MNPFMSPNTRRQLIARVAALVSGTGVAPLRRDPIPPARDRALLRLCNRFGVLEHRKLLLYDGPRRIADDDVREERLSPIIAEQIEVLGALCDMRATDLVSLRAKAIVWALWDCGELFQRAARYSLVEDRLLASVLSDLGAAP